MPVTKYIGILLARQLDTPNAWLVKWIALGLGEPIERRVVWIQFNAKVIVFIEPDWLDNHILLRATLSNSCIGAI